MKKILALLLSLMLLLPVVAMGEAASNPDVYSVDLGDFSITITSDDLLQKGVKAEGSILFILYPAYDESNQFHCNLNAVWTAEDLSVIGVIGAEVFAQSVLEQSTAALAADGIAVDNSQLLNAVYDEETQSTTLIYSMDIDYTSVGLDLAITMYQLQLYMPVSEGNTYIFTISADTLENTEAMLAYLNTIEFAE